MNARSLRATPGRLGRLILRRLFDKPHRNRRPHLPLDGQSPLEHSAARDILPLLREPSHRSR